MNHFNTTFKLVAVLFAILFFANKVNAQVTLSSESFENALTDFTVTTGTAAYASGNSASGDRPASASFSTAGTYGFKVFNATTVLTSDIISTQNYSGASLSFKLAAFSIASTSNGMDASDYVKVEVSTDGGSTYTTCVTVNGNNNAYWSYTSGTGTATTTYANSGQTFAPSNGGSRTTDGYSTVSVTSLPQTSNLVVRISLSNSSSNEQWVIDDFKVIGTATCINPTSGISALTISNTTADGFDASWTNGNSNKRLITVHPTSALQSIPVAGTSYTPNTNWNNAGQINTNNRVVFAGAQSSVTGISNLSPQTNYTVKAFEYTNSSSCYLSLGWASTTFYTLSSSASTQVSGLSATGVSGSQIDLSWTAATWPSSGATANGYVILGRTDGTNPSVTGINDANTSAGFSLPSGTTVIATINSGSTTSYSHTGLGVSQTVNYIVIPFTWDGINVATINYKKSGTIPTISGTTLASSVPSISSANTSNVYVGSSIILTGTNFSGLTSVKVDGVAATYSVVSSTQLNITIPSGISSANISVVNGSGTATFNSITYSGYITNSSATYTSGGSWLGGVQPPTGSDITIAHMITVSGNNTINVPRNITIANGGSIVTAGNAVASNTGTITINAGGALTLGSNSTWTSSSSVTNNGTISFNASFISTLKLNAGTFSNNGTLTLGAGNITTAGTVSLTGATTFNSLTLNGATTLPAGSTINGTLTLNTGGSLVSNSPIYGPSATLVYGKSSPGTGLEWVLDATAGNAGAPENVTVNSGSTLTLNGTGTYYVDGTLSIAGTVTMSGSSLLEVDGNMSGGGTFTHGNRKVTFNGTTQTVSMTTTFYDVDVNATTFTLSGTVTVNRIMNISANTAATLSGTLNIASTSGSPSNLYGSLINTGTISITNSTGFILQNGSTYVHNTTTSVTSIAGVTKNANSTFIFRGSNTLATSVSISGRTFGNLRFESTSGSWTPAPTGSTATTINGNLFVGTGVNLSGSSYSSTLTINGNVVVDGTMPSSVPLNVNLAGSLDTISGSGTIRFGTLTVSGNYNLLNNMTATATTVSGTLNMNSNIVSGTSFTVSSGATIGIGHLQGITSSGNQGNVQTSGTRTYNSNATYLYNGTASQVAGSGLPATVANLTVQNTGTGSNNIV
ncbi:MAG: hypothetical protein ORN56_04330, partial [Chitinophagales bacterium]|nr:hypothetical protein [Chitinophagales bacterium]